MAARGPMGTKGWRRAWTAGLAVAVMAVAGPRFGAGPARAQDSLEAPASGRSFLSEIVDSTYFVGPAEFFALDLPVVARGAQAVHIFGDVQVSGKGRDVIVRIFRSSDYQDWLKRRSGKEGKPLWSSPRSRSIHVDQPLPAGVPAVLLLDNGYSIRTAKRVRVQFQIRYEEGGAGAAAAASETPPAAPAPAEGDIAPRSNAADDTPPPPPPPPPSDSTN